MSNILTHHSGQEISDPHQEGSRLPQFLNMTAAWFKKEVLPKKDQKEEPQTPEHMQAKPVKVDSPFHRELLKLNPDPNLLKQFFLIHLLRSGLLIKGSKDPVYGYIKRLCDKDDWVYQSTYADLEEQVSQVRENLLSPDYSSPRDPLTDPNTDQINSQKSTPIIPEQNKSAKDKSPGFIRGTTRLFMKIALGSAIALGGAASINPVAKLVDKASLKFGDGSKKSVKEKIFGEKLSQLKNDLQATDGITVISREAGSIPGVGTELRDHPELSVSLSIQIGDNSTPVPIDAMKKCLSSLATFQQETDFGNISLTIGNVSAAEGNTEPVTFKNPLQCLGKLTIQVTPQTAEYLSDVPIIATDLVFNFPDANGEENARDMGKILDRNPISPPVDEYFKMLFLNIDSQKGKDADAESFLPMIDGIAKYVRKHPASFVWKHRDDEIFRPTQLIKVNGVPLRDLPPTFSSTIQPLLEYERSVQNQIVASNAPPAELSTEDKLSSR